MSNMYYYGTVTLYTDEGDIDVDVRAEATGWYSSGDSWGYGCEPPDGDFTIDEVEYVKAYDDYSKDPVEITDEMKKQVMKKLYDVEFKEHEFEPD